MLRINGKTYSWADVDIKLPGLNIEVQEIDYSDELEKELAYGKGQRPRGFSEGNYKSEGKMVLLRDDYDALIDYCRSQGVGLYKLAIPKIIVSYANEGDRTRTDVLNMVTFTKRGHKGAQGDKSLKIDLDFLIVHGIDGDGVKPL